ncbi:ClpP/crotonase [Meredithblackwellia eburnea MCA 4105]
MAAQQVLLSFSKETHSATLTLNNPSKGNSLGPELQDTFLNHLDRLSKDDEVHSVIITGNGKFFCTGMNLGADGSSTSGDAEAAWDGGKEFFEAINNFPKPTIALINGPCYGGGNGLAFACDIRIAVDSAIFVLSEAKLGLVPALISKYLIREWGPSLSRYAMLTTTPITASLLHSHGAILSIHSSLPRATTAAQEVAKALLGSSPTAMKRVKEIVRETEGGDIGEKERKEGFREMMAPSEEALEGIGAWRKGKKADWIGFKRKKGAAKL